MAVAYQSIASSSWANNASTLITKPTGVVSGDVMFAFLFGSRNGGTDPAMSSVPSGWTEILNTTVDSSTGRMISYYKVAGGSEPSDYTWTWTSANPDTAGCIIRTDGGINPSVLALVSDDGTTPSSAAGTFTGGVTPSTADALLIFAAFSKDAGNSHSSQALTTDNPSWTERLDSKSGLGTSAIMSVATASRTQATATGNFTITIDSGSASTDSIGHLISISPVVNASISPSVLSVVATVLDAASVAGGATASPSVISVTTSVQAPTVTTPAPDWTNTDKNSTTWTNENKS